MNFTNPVIYTVTAEDGSQVEYVATFSIAQIISRILASKGIDAVLPQDAKARRFRDRPFCRFLEVVAFQC